MAGVAERLAAAAAAGAQRDHRPVASDEPPVGHLDLDRPLDEQRATRDGHDPTGVVAHGVSRSEALAGAPAGQQVLGEALLEQEPGGDAEDDVGRQGRLPPDEVVQAASQHLLVDGVGLHVLVVEALPGGAAGQPGEGRDSRREPGELVTSIIANCPNATPRSLRCRPASDMRLTGASVAAGAAST